MKKIISLFLAVCMTFLLIAPVSAAAGDDYNVPTILIRGDGSSLSDSEGNLIWPIEIGSEEEKQEIIDAIVNVVLPYWPIGLIKDDWTGFCDALYDAVFLIFKDTLLDGNGEPVVKGSGLSPEYQQENETMRFIDVKAHWGQQRYYYEDYTFNYDFRLSPFEVMDDLHTYIKDVMATTGATKVNIVGRCLGGGFVMTYLDYYLDKINNEGMAPYIKNVMFDCVVSNDCDPLTDAFRGKIDLDSDALARFLNEFVDDDDSVISGFMDMTPFLNEVILTSYNLFNELGVLDDVLITPFEEVYADIYGDLVPRLISAVMGTWPGYWTAVDPDHYEEARDFVYGEEGSEKRQGNEGLVAKLDKYHYEVASQRNAILDECKALGVHFGAVAKYGYQLFPFVESQNQLADQYVTLESSSFGATTALIGETLSEDYIASRVELGFADYISADKQVDLSTSVLKDTTWIIKNAVHGAWGAEDAIVNNFCWGTSVSTLNDTRIARFTVYDDKTETISTMTEENCGISQWEDVNQNKNDATLWTKLAALMRWLTAMLKFIMGLAENPGSLAA
ncbi:MAG: hypothetical protein IJW86_09510 [Clostridia bacterium]|nr:hypothetical protein [Clostridia bacterium]